MKTVDPAVVDAIRSAHDVNAVPRLMVEWNLNRYTDNIEVDNDPPEADEGYDIEMFPVESLIGPNRPTAGIVKARVGEARVADPYGPHNGKGKSARYYVSDVDDHYKYWTSPYETDTNGVFPANTVQPFVLYPDSVRVNKIVIGFEDTWAQPDSFDIRVRGTDGATWTVASSSPTVNAKGQSVLYWNGTNWSSNQPADQSPTTVITGVQARVSSLKGVPGGSPTGAKSHLNLIEISARREHDMTGRMISAENTFDMGERSVVYPIGTVTSNVATVTLFNGDGLFNAENPDSTFGELMEPNAKFKLDYIYNIDGETYEVPGFVMYGGPWAGQRSNEVSVECTDYSKYFQEVKPRPTAYLDVSAAELVWRICDSVGFVDYEIQADDITTQHKIPVWWTDGEMTAWELFADIATATQTAIYFDSYGKLQVRTRSSAYNDTADTVWTMRGEEAGTELPDIISLEQLDEVSSNKVKVSYSTTDIDPVTRGQSKTQVLWEPEGTVALRACPLLKNLDIGDNFISLPPKEAKIWPFKGMMNIQGEIISYEGKRFVYYTYDENQVTKADGTIKTEYSNPKRNYGVPKSNEEKNKLNAKTPFQYRYRNHYTGQLKVSERGVWNSTERNHDVEAKGYTVRRILNGNRKVDVKGFSHNKAQSRVSLFPPKRFKDANDLMVATRGAEFDSGYYYYGVSMRFAKFGGRTQRAGLVFHNNSLKEDGYYIEVIPSKKLNTGKKRAKNKEITIYSRSDGKWIKQGKGSAHPIIEGRDYEIDVQFKSVGNDHRISVWVDGKKALTRTVEGGQKNPWGGKFGMYTRGDTRVSYEYLYAIRREESQEPHDDFSYLDKIDGAYTGDQLMREWVWRSRSRTRRIKKRWPKAKPKFNITFYDEFGPYVHEVREYDVKFDPMPAITSRLYMGNDYSVVCPEYRSDAFGAKFFVANADRKTAIAHGEDTLTLKGESATINPIMTVIGRSITVAESETVEAKNELQIRKRGEIETEINSQWIQSKDMAQEIANWIEKHWSKGADEQTVELFGNPLFDLGDVVAVEYPERDMSAATHKYFVVGINNRFDTGLETTVTLRRVVV